MALGHGKACPAPSPVFPETLRAQFLCYLTPLPHSELEDFVEDLKKDSSSTGRVVTLKDVEDGAFLLRQVGEAVATLKGEASAGREVGIMFPGMCKNLQI